MLTPGAGFYSTPDKGLDEVRIAYVLEAPKIRESTEILAAALHCLPEEDSPLSLNALTVGC